LQAFSTPVYKKIRQGRYRGVYAVFIPMMIILGIATRVTMHPKAED